VVSAASLFRAIFHGQSVPPACRRRLFFSTLRGGLAQRYLHDPPAASVILTDLAPLMDISIVDHWCLSWFGHVRHRRIVAPISAVFRAGMGTLRRPSSPERDSPWPFSLFFGAYDGVGRISGHCGGLHRVYFVK
jgi:hypothetical protein